MKVHLPFKNMHVILCRPEKSGNVGSTARVMNNFGLSNLRIVSTRKTPHVSTIAATKFATPHATHILNNAKNFETLAEAVKDLSLVVALSRRGRFFQPKFLELDDFRDKILSLEEPQQVGFLFGSESTGLTNDDLTFADYTMTIPSAGSLNLSHAVLAVGYELHAISFSWKQAHGNVAIKEGHITSGKENERATREMIMRFENDIKASLEATNFPEDRMTQSMHYLHKIVTKAELTPAEMGFLFNMFNHFRNGPKPLKRKSEE